MGSKASTPKDATGMKAIPAPIEKNRVETRIEVAVKGVKRPEVDENVKQEGTNRWIAFNNQNLTAEKATIEAKNWCLEKNKVVYGFYTFLGHNVQSGSAAGPKYPLQFQVNFKVQKRNERWMFYKNQDLIPDIATILGKKWCEDKNKVVYGTYTFLEHNVTANRKKGEYMFRVHFKPFEFQTEVTLIQKIGGQSVVDSAANLFFGKFATDNRMRDFYAKREPAMHREKHMKLLSFVFGGETLKPGSFEKNGLTDQQFNLIVELQSAAFQELGVAQNLISEAMARVEKMRNSLVGQKDGTTRWVDFENQRISAQQAQAWATKWCEEMNEVVNGQYTYLEHNIKDSAIHAELYQEDRLSSDSDSDEDDAFQFERKPEHGTRHGNVTQIRTQKTQVAIKAQFKVFFKPDVRKVIPGRWIDFENQQITPTEATKQAKAWCEAKNKVVYGTYTFLEHNVQPGQQGSLQFKVGFNVQQRNDRWIEFEDQNITAIQATALGKAWCIDRNFSVNGKYTYLEHNVREGLVNEKLKFKVNFVGAERVQTKKQTFDCVREIDFENQFMQNPAMATQVAQKWIEEQNKTVHGTYTLYGHNVKPGQRQRLQFTVHFQPHVRAEAKAAPKGITRWVLFDDKAITAEKATLQAKNWCEDQNKVVHGKYTYWEHNVKPGQKDAPAFKVTFTAQQRNERWITYDNQQIDSQNATQVAKQWCEDKNAVVHGTYTYLEHNVRPGHLGTFQFKVHFKETERPNTFQLPILPSTSTPTQTSTKPESQKSTSVQRWIEFDDQKIPPALAQQIALNWCHEKNKVVYGTYTFIEHNVTTQQQDRLKFKVSFDAKKRNERWIQYEQQNITAIDAVQVARKWCLEKNLAVSGEYTYLQHNVNPGFKGPFAFKVHFKLNERMTAKPTNSGIVRWVDFENQFLKDPAQAAEVARLWCKTQNSVVNGTYTFYEHNVTPNQKDRLQFKVHYINTERIEMESPLKGITRWILFENKAISTEDATTYAKNWCDAQNKIVHGKYTFWEHNVKSGSTDAPAFQVTFMVQQKNERWINYENQQITQDQAQIIAKYWCEQKNEIVNGVYKYIEHNVRPGFKGPFAFKVHFQLNQRIPAKPTNTGIVRWVDFENQFLKDPSKAAEIAKQWCKSQNSVVNGTYTFYEHNVTPNQKDRLQFKVYFELNNSVATNPAPKGIIRWILFEQKEISANDATTQARNWCEAQNKVVNGKYTFYEHNVQPGSTDAPAFKVHFLKTERIQREEI